MTVIIEPGIAAGTVAAPPSKSGTHRLLIASCLAGKGSVVRNMGDGEDIAATLDCLAALGAAFSGTASEICVTRELTLSGKPISGEKTEIPLCPCRESGSTLRFLLPLALACRGGAVFSGSKRLMERGVEVYRTVLEPMGIRFRAADSILTVQGTLRSGTFCVPGNSSSQYITGLLFALPLLSRDSTLKIIPPVESTPYITLTLDVLRRFRVQIYNEGPYQFVIPGNQQYRPGIHTVEGDWSNAAYFYALQLRSDNLRVIGLREDSAQGDRCIAALLQRLKKYGTEINLSDMPDLGPVLFAAAAMLRGGIFTGIHRLRLKESDRIQAMADELKKFSIRTVVEENRFTVLPGTLQKPCVPLDSHNDHRIAMALAILCTVTGGTIYGAEAVQKSFPDFFTVLRSLGISLFFT